MQRTIIIGSRQEAYLIAKFCLSNPYIELQAIITEEKNARLISLAKEHDIPLLSELKPAQIEKVDLIINTTNDLTLEEKLLKNFQQKPLLVPKDLVDLLLPFVKKQSFENDNLYLLLNTIQDGIIVVDEEGYIKLMNDAAMQMININSSVINQAITEVLPHSRLPHVLQTRQKEINRPFPLGNKRAIVTTRIPLINKDQQLVGAFAIFKDKNEIIRLAEENTDLKKIKTMLEAIIYSSEEAISVVDEEGKGLMINPAYTKITGLSEADVLGKPATVDIAEGESIHMEVLRTKKPIRGAKLKVGPANKEVFVNVAPVIVNDELKGSVAVIHDISNIEKLTSELKRAQQKLRELEASYTFEDIIGESEEINLAINQAKMAAKTPATVLLRGASGTGKELFAHAIHNASDRKHHKFIRVNCAALTESVLESELFGYVGGAFTGAKSQGKKGLFEVANKGSIFLDEIGELSLATQAKLLRVLQEKEVVRVGGTRPIPVDVRIIAATNANLEKKIREKSFREDLYYRLNRLPIHIPSLKERKGDIDALVHVIISKVNQLYGRTVQSISPEAIKKLRQYDWPGNVRELENIISRAIIFMNISDRRIEAHHIENLNERSKSMNKGETNRIHSKQSLKDALDQYEKQFIKQVYEQNEFNKTKTAEQLQISIRSLYYKLEKYELS